VMTDLIIDETTAVRLLAHHNARITANGHPKVAPAQRERAQ